MSLGSGFLENLHHFTFTPIEHQVECVSMAGFKNLTFVMGQPIEKSFLVLMLVKQEANYIRGGRSKAVILLFRKHQVALWASFLSRMTDLKVVDIGDDVDIDTGQLIDSGGVIVTTHATFPSLLARKLLDMNSVRLVVVDNIQASLGSRELESVISGYHSVPKNRAPRFIAFTPNILHCNRDDHLFSLPQQIARLNALLPASVECACEIASQLRFLARPREALVLFETAPKSKENQLVPFLEAGRHQDLESEIRSMVAHLREWILEQNYSLYDTYGEEFGDLIADIPDPATLPLAILQDFLHILDDLGVWCADRAAVLLMIKIDKLKTREKYERHFLLLSLVFTLMVKIRKWCDDAFGSLTDIERLEAFSRPKLSRLLEVLANFTPRTRPAVQGAQRELTDSVPCTEASSDPSAQCELTLSAQCSEPTFDSAAHCELTASARNSTACTQPASTHVDATCCSTDPAATMTSQNPANQTGRDGAPSANKDQKPGPRRLGRRHGPIPEDPEALCCLLVVNSAFTAKILYHFLKDLSRHKPEFYFLSPQYAVNETNSSDPRDTEIERKKQEEALRRFRMRECNILISSSVLEEGIDYVKCNLVILLEPPLSFTRYVYSKVKCKNVNGFLVFMCEEQSQERLVRQLDSYKMLENQLLSNCSNRAAAATEDAEADSCIGLLPPYPPNSASPPLNLSTAILILNRYCAKLPSDTFTRLTPAWTVERTADDLYFCCLFLPINSPLKELIVGMVMPTPALARRAAAYQACIRLHEEGELDSNLLPLGKESILSPSVLAPLPPIERILDDSLRPGTTKRRQYYYKRVALCLTGVEPCYPAVSSGRSSELDTPDSGTESLLHTVRKHYPNAKYYSSEDDPILKARYEAIAVPELALYNLYAVRMRLTCPIPEEQNTRGRRIHDPADSDQLFGMLLPSSLPAVPAFPIYTRAGEVLVDVKLVQSNLPLTRHYLRKVYIYHVFIFYSVLRLEKYPMVFNAQAADHICSIFVPLKSVPASGKLVIDWQFLDIIQYLATKQLKTLSDEERRTFVFRTEDFADAVIMPWYRNQDQPQYFYVAELCTHLNPSSAFPGQGFDTFEKYYSTKYGIHIQNVSQPLLDVDHTSARLNFLTPRYVNRKGIALPTSSEETKRNKRENLDQKQILVPELCAIHPFSASLWRQAVALPCIMYRLNGLLIAEQIRTCVAAEMRLGRAVLPAIAVDGDEDHEDVWPPLNFGWTLADVVNNTSSSAVRSHNSSGAIVLPSGGKSKAPDGNERDEGSGEEDEDDEEEEAWASEDMGRMATKLMSKLAREERLNKKKKLEIGTWSNDMAGQQQQQQQRRNQQQQLGSEEEDEDEDEDELADIQLPDNLTFISTPNNQDWGESSQDWGTGIASKNFRVGSPTFFASGSPRGGGGAAGNLMADLEGFSCSDSDDDWPDQAADSDSESDHQVGKARIEFHGDNLAETVEEEREAAAREERQARDRDQEARMVEDVPWDPHLTLVPDSSASSEDLVAQPVLRDHQMEILTPDLPLLFTKPVGNNKSITNPATAANNVEVTNLGAEVKSVEFTYPDTEAIEVTNSKIEANSVELHGPGTEATGKEDARTDAASEENEFNKKTAYPHFIPYLPQIKEEADLETVLSHLSLAPDLTASSSSSSANSTFWGVIPWPDVDQTDPVNFDYQPDLAEHQGPSPSIILQALTMSNSNDAINLERLETIGDSFLKYAITSYLYCQHPSIHEGKLSHLRSKQVSNLNLYNLGQERGLGEYMIATKFEPHDNWLPPCYHVPRELEQALIESGVPASHWNMAELPGVENMTSQQICQLLRKRVETRELQEGDEEPEEEQSIQDIPSFIPYNLLTQHSIPDKSIADCVEALIGAYLIACGPRGALLLMTWLGISVLPGSREAPGHLMPPPSPLFRSPWIPHPELRLNYLLDGYNKFEQMIGYVWRDKSYLLQAFSHASYSPNRLTDCYQRLEFLGDAVLDYLITRHLYQDNRLHSPGALTDLRSALVNNTMFACLAVRHQFHKFFKHHSPGLQMVCDRFVRIQAENNWKVSEECYLIEEEETEEAEDIEVPKALGDIFESVAGSIYLDSGLSLNAVWTVYYRMMKDEINKFSGHVPKSPIRELLELEPETAKFSKPEKLADGRRVRVSVEVFGKGVFKGIGRNYRIAKCTAAKCALKALKKMESRRGKK